MTLLSILIITVIITALAFDFVNGWNDSANAIATVVATRVMSPTVAVIMAAVLNLVGAMVGLEVADTMSKFIRFGPKYRPGLVAELRSGDKSVVRIDSEIAFAWNDEPPDAELSTEPFEATWRGFLHVKEAAKIRLHADVQGDVTVELKGKSVLKGSTENKESISGDEFSASATEVPLTVTFRKTQPSAHLKLFWSSDKFDRELVPDDLLLPATIVFTSVTKKFSKASGPILVLFRCWISSITRTPNACRLATCAICTIISSTLARRLPYQLK